MRILKKGETAAKSTIANVESNFVECVHATVHESLKGDERFQMAWSLDFSNLTNEEIFEAAAEHFVIKIRRGFANDTAPADVDWDGAQFDCKKFVSKRMSKVDKIAKDLSALSDDALQALGLDDDMIAAFKAKQS